MSNVTRQSIEDILGALNDDVFAAIEATGASLTQVKEAKSLADGTSDIVGTGEGALAGPVQQVLIILGRSNAVKLGSVGMALLDPPAVYPRPADVLSDTNLTDAQKIEILRRWEYDACEISVAEDEGMPARDGRVLQEVLQALEGLVGHIDSEHTPPTKQGGLERSAVTPKAGKS